MREIFAGLSRTGLAFAGSWSSENSAGSSEASLRKAINRISDQERVADAMPGFIQFDVSDNAFADAQYFADWDDARGLLQFGLHKAAENGGTVAMQQFQARCILFLREIFPAVEVYSAELTAFGGVGSWLPDVALVTTHSQITVTNQMEVEERYEDPSTFWNAGWTIAAEHNGQRLLTREIALLAGPDYFARIMPHQWAMARTAKLGETGYEDLEVLAAEESIYRAGAARLIYKGCSGQQKVAEYSCALTAGQHIQGWEIFALRAIVKGERLPDGAGPVSRVRVVFPERWMAESEKRPLLDVGCEVWVQANKRLEQVRA